MLFAQKFSDTYSAAFPVVRGPRHFKQAWFLRNHHLLAWRKKLDRNNVAALELCPRFEAATNIGHILDECMLIKEMSFVVHPSDFNRDTIWERIFASSLGCEYVGPCVQVSTQ